MNNILDLCMHKQLLYASYKLLYLLESTRVTSPQFAQQTQPTGLPNKSLETNDLPKALSFAKNHAISTPNHPTIPSLPKLAKKQHIPYI